MRAWQAELQLVGAGGKPVDLRRTLASHGVADLPPNEIDAEAATLTTTLGLPQGATTVHVGDGAGETARVTGSGPRAGVLDDDVVKTVCTTNCAWSATVRMTTALVDHLGEQTPDDRRAFPTPAAIAETGDDLYRDVVQAGYRGAYLRSLAAGVADGILELEALNDPDLSDAEVAERLLALPGSGATRPRT
jgi:hypothetical protein